MGAADQQKIRRMQANLSVIRSVSHWTTERLGEEIGVSRQTINSLEHGKTTMSKTQYLALRTVFNHEAIASGNTALAQVIQALVDEPAEDELQEADTVEEDIGGDAAPCPDTMDAMSVTTSILTDKRAVAAIAAALPAAVVPGVASLVIAPLLLKAIQKAQK